MTRPVEPVYRLLGQKAKKMRIERGLTQEELAQLIGLKRASVANLETGRQRLMMHHVESLARVFGTTTKQLMKGIWT